MPGPEPGRSVATSPVAFIGALAVYVALGLVAKTAVLNWVVGPLFPLLVLFVVPRLVRSRGRR